MLSYCCFPSFMFMLLSRLAFTPTQSYDADFVLEFVEKHDAAINVDAPSYPFPLRTFHDRAKTLFKFDTLKTQWTDRNT